MFLKIVFAIQMVFAFPLNEDQDRSEDGTFYQTGKISDLEKIKNPDEKNLMIAFALSGKVKSPERQKIIDKYYLKADTDSQKDILERAFSSAIDEKNFSAIDDILGLAGRNDRSRRSGMYCEFVNDSVESITTSDAKENIEIFIRENLDKVYEVAQKYNMVNQPCGKNGTLRDVYAKYFPDLEKKFADSHEAERASAQVTDKQKYSMWKCTSSDIFTEVNNSYKYVESEKKKPNSVRVSVLQGPCSFHGRIQKNKDGTVSFKADENLMGFKFEVGKLKSASDLIAAMKKAKLLSEEGKAVVDEKQVVEAAKQASVQKNKEDPGHAVMFPFVERKFENTKGQR